MASSVQLLKLALPLIPKYGFTRTALAESALYLPSTAERPQPEPLSDTSMSALFGEGDAARRALINAWLAQGISCMSRERDAASDESKPAQNLRTVRELLQARLAYNEPVLAHLPEAFALLGSPPSAIPPLDPVPALKHALSVADEACYLSGDATTQTSWYARRIALAGVFSAAELHQLASPTTAPAFLDSLLESSNKVHQALDEVVRGKCSISKYGKRVMEPGVAMHARQRTLFHSSISSSYLQFVKLAPRRPKLPFANLFSKSSSTGSLDNPTLRPSTSASSPITTNPPSSKSKFRGKLSLAAESDSEDSSSARAFKPRHTNNYSTPTVDLRHHTRGQPSERLQLTSMRSTHYGDEGPVQAPTKASLKAWWHSFTFSQRAKKDAEAAAISKGEPVHTIFGRPLKESLKNASVQISTANANGELYVWGCIPVVVAKCGLFLKENATEVEGVFRVNGSAKRMRELQAAFEMPPRYGKNLDWKKEIYTPHDVASVFRRYLTQMPEPVIPHSLYHEFRNTLAKQPHNQDDVIAKFKSLIRSMPRANQYLLLYVLDLLSVFAKKSDKNRMTATNLAVIFRPGILSHPTHEMLPHEHHLSQQVLEFLIAHQDWFMLEIPPPPQSDLGNTPAPGPGTTGQGKPGQSGSFPKSGFGRHGRDDGGTHHGAASGSGSGGETADESDFHVMPSSDEEHNASVSGGWKLIVRGDRDKANQRKVIRRRTLASPTTPVRSPSFRRREHGGVLEEESLTPPESGSPVKDSGGLSPVSESPTKERDFGVIGGGALGVTRSRTLPSRRKHGEATGGGGVVAEREKGRVLRKQKRASSSQSSVPTTGALQIDTSRSTDR
ncbi:hypothetical protein ONZ45_g3948 [Pleurotus djamor]|nr:hypothetical protein ONZ45_g3948 [Pleurotus djamor]